MSESHFEGGKPPTGEQQARAAWEGAKEIQSKTHQSHFGSEHSENSQLEDVRRRLGFGEQYRIEHAREQNPSQETKLPALDLMQKARGNRLKLGLMDMTPFMDELLKRAQEAERKIWEGSKRFSFWALVLAILSVFPKGLRNETGDETAEKTHEEAA